MLTVTDCTESPIEAKFLEVMLRRGGWSLASMPMRDAYRSAMAMVGSVRSSLEIFENAGWYCATQMTLPVPELRKYRLDFAFFSMDSPIRINVEADGHEWHQKTREQVERDHARDRVLITKGWRVMRFTGSEIHRDAYRCQYDVNMALVKLSTAARIRVRGGGIDMTWFKVDDRFYAHAKVLELSLDAIGLWTKCGSFCAAHPKLEGRLSFEQVSRISGPGVRVRAIISKLVAAGLWDKSGDGWSFHDWLMFNPTQEQVDEIRAKRASAGKQGGKQSGSNRAANIQAESKQSASTETESVRSKNEPSPVPSRPVPLETTPVVPSEDPARDPAPIVSQPDPRFTKDGLDGSECAVWASALSGATGRPCTQPHWSDGKTIARVIQAHAKDRPGSAEQWFRDSVATFVRSVDVTFGGLTVRRWEVWENSGRPGYEPESGEIEIARDDYVSPPPLTEQQKSEMAAMAPDLLAKLAQLR